MRFWRELKYAMLLWLVSDICKKSNDDCSDCAASHEYEIDGITNLKFPACSAHDIYRQARKVWKLEG